MNLKKSSQKLKNRLRHILLTLSLPIARLSKKIILPGFEGIPLYDVSIFFYKGITKSSTNLRASAISFDLVMAMAPAILFLFTLIPFLPIPNLHESILGTIEGALPQNAYLAIQSTIEDIMSRHQEGWLSISFLLSIFFASNAMITVMNAFNQSVLVSETRSNIKIRLIALLLVVIVLLIVIISAGIQVFSFIAINKLSDLLVIRPFWFTVMFFTAKYLVFVAILFTVYSFIYYLAPAKRGMYRFVSAGSTLATVASIIVLEVFSFFINNFGQYNKLYGSLGTLIVLLIWININAIILLIGFELNASIYYAKMTDNDDKFVLPT